MDDDALQKSPFRLWLVEAFVFVNLTFLAVDVYIAHMVNDFAKWTQWIPVFFSVSVPLLLLPGLLKRQHNTSFTWWAGLLVGSLSIVVGVYGLFLHLENAFFQEQTIKSLVYSAPFIAPLSYAGIGLLLILNRLESNETVAWGVWIVFLAMCGFVGNLGLSLADHSQNGFFYTAEWISVFAAAFAVSFLLVVLFRPDDRNLIYVCSLVMALEILVGLIGFGYHLIADLKGPSESIQDNFVYGAPIFAPLLFANLALLAMIGLWELYFFPNEKQADE
ncbi:MAG: hypothetical protein MPJ24_09290 [Pirellulaceae bacterium]|nr:hypothetical protein [Pirellulaceae bacterium]